MLDRSRILLPTTNQTKIDRKENPTRSMSRSTLDDLVIGNETITRRFNYIRTRRDKKSRNGKIEIGNDWSSIIVRDLGCVSRNDIKNRDYVNFVTASVDSCR